MPEIQPDIAAAIAGGEFYLALRLDPNDFACDDYEDAHNFVHDTAGKVVLSGYSGEVIAEIGSFFVYQVDGDGLIAQGVSIHDAFDQYQETFEYYEDLIDGPIPWEYKRKVRRALDCEDDILPLGMLIISDLSIRPEYRGKDFGLVAMKCLIQRFRIGAGLIVMTPFPMQYSGAAPEELAQQGLTQYKGSERACTMKLRAHFARLGFRLIPGTNVMALNTIYAMDNVELDPTEAK